jgi:hypothetical protein
MSDIATLEPTPAQSAPVPAKRERIPPRVKRAIEALVTGEVKLQKEAAKLVGLSDTYLCGALKKPAAEAFYARRSREIIRGATMRASARAVQLLDAASEHVSADMTKHLLAINGIKPAESSQVSVNVAISPGYVIDLRDPRDVTPRPNTLTESVE